ARPRDRLRARPEQEVVRVREDDPRADLLEVARQDALHGRLRADGHEDRRRHVAVREAERPGARGAVAAFEAEGERRGGYFATSLSIFSTSSQCSVSARTCARTRSSSATSSPTSLRRALYSSRPRRSKASDSWRSERTSCLSGSGGFSTRIV